MGNLLSGRRDAPPARASHSRAHRQNWAERNILKLVEERKLAPRIKGTDEETTSTKECPICFLNFEAMNLVKCCKNYICTECFVQVKTSASSENCPYCASKSFTVCYDGPFLPSCEGSVPATPASIATTRASPEATPDSRPRGSSLGSPVLLTVEDRLAIEEEMRHQRDADLMAQSRRSRPSERGIASTSRTARLRNVLREFEGEISLQQLEEMMLLEAIRLSMEESSTPQRNTPPAATTSNNSVPANPSDEDEMQMAIAMSIEPSASVRSPSEESAPDISRLIGAIDRVLGNDQSDDDSKSDEY